MPDPNQMPKSVKRLQRFSKAIQKTYGGFTPERMAESIGRRKRQVLSVPKAVYKEVATTAGAVHKQARSDIKEIHGALKKIKGKLGL